MAQRKTNTVVGTAKDPAWQPDGWLHEFYSTIPNERERYTPSKLEVDSILSDLVQRLDSYFVESAFNFRRDQAADPANTPSLEHFIDRLKPHTRLIEKRLRQALPDNYPDNPVPEPDSDFTRMIMDIEEAAYVVGMFMGAKLSGASAETLDRLRKNLVP